MDAEATLRDTVERQALARVGGDDATFASFLTAQAVLQLGGGGLGAPRLPRPRRFVLLEASDHGDGSGESRVRFEGGGSYVLRTAWRREAGAWRGVSVEAPPEEMGAPWWIRLVRRGPRPAATVERRDLS